MSSSLEYTHITLVGYGKMGSALASGWLNRGLNYRHLCVVDPFLTPLQRHKLNDQGAKTFDHLNQTGSQPTDCLFLAVKPQSLGKTMSYLDPAIKNHSVVVSIIAGKTSQTIGEHFSPQTAVVRAMPNTPAAIARGVTAAYAPTNLPANQKSLITNLLEAVGDVIWLDKESDIDIVTAISGSGPAYFFYFTECLIKAAETLGLSTGVAERLAVATFSGAGALTEATQESVKRLRQNVSSPGGTTLAGLDELMRDDRLLRLLQDTCQAAARRATEISRES